MKWLAKSILAVSLLIFSGCNFAPSLPKEVKPKIDPNLPVIDAKSIKTMPDINAIALEWEGCDKSECLGYHIYRANLQKDGEKLKRIVTIDNRYSNHYLDTDDLKPNTVYLYAISINGKNNTESQISKTIKVTTYPVLNSVSLIYAVSNLPRSVKIVWRPHTNLAVNKYILEKRTLTGDDWEEVAVIKNRLSSEYIDKGLEDRTTYYYRLKAVRFDGIISNPSQVVTATTRALPKGGLGLTASTSLPRKIELHWKISDDVNVVSYKIYKSDNTESGYEVIANVDKNLDSFIDNINENGVIKFYKITTIDKDGLESDLNTVPPVMGKTLESPKMPTITLALIKDNKVILNWQKGDERAVSYNIYKRVDKGFFASEEAKIIKGIKDLRFEDGDIVRGVTYKYAIQAVDENGLVSQKTPEVSLTFPKIKVKSDN